MDEDSRSHILVFPTLRGVIVKMSVFSKSSSWIMRGRMVPRSVIPLRLASGGDPGKAGKVGSSRNLVGPGGTDRGELILGTVSWCFLFVVVQLMCVDRWKERRRWGR